MSGTVKNPAIKAITLVTNGSRRPVTVQNKTFATKVPLIRGENRIQAITRGVASLPIKVIADIPRSDIWMELSWAGEGDIDLHLYLPKVSIAFTTTRQPAARSSMLITGKETVLSILSCRMPFRENIARRFFTIGQ